MNYSKYLSALIVLALAGCVGAPEKGVPPPGSVPVVPVKKPPVVAVTPAEKPVAAPAPGSSSAGTAEENPPADAPSAAAASSPQPEAVEPSVVPAKEEPAAQPASAASDVPAKPKTVSFRCGYWRRPQTPLELFIRADGKFKRFPMFELSFQKYFSVPGDVPVVLYVKKGEDYEPYFAVDTSGMEDCAVILFPDFDPADPEKRDQLRIFDFSEKTAPLGSLVIYNWFSEEKLKCEFIFREQDDASHTQSDQIATLSLGEFCATVPIKNDRQTCGLKLFAGDSGKELYSSSLVLRNDNCTYIFVIPPSEKESGAPDFRVFKRRK